MRDLIEEAIAAGKITRCPTAAAAGHKRLGMKKRKGERERPCPRCQKPVQYLKGKWTAFGRPRRGWHWINSQDGTHHRCGDFVETYRVVAEAEFDAALEVAWKQAMERDDSRTEVGAEHG